MDEKSSIQLKCPICGAVGRGGESYLRRQATCPKCKSVVRFLRFIPSTGAKPDLAQDLPSSVVRKEAAHFNVEDVSEERPVDEGKRLQLDTHAIVAAWVAGIGLAILATSFLLPWASFGSISFAGIVSGYLKVFFVLTILDI